MMGPAVGIVGVGSYLPARSLTNDEVAARFGLPGEWVEEKTGIRLRYVAATHETTTDLAAAAARRAVDDAGIDVGQLDLILATSSTPGRFTPSVACGVQGALGAGRATAMDVSAACAGFIYAIHVARAMLAAGAVEGPVLVVAAERFSGHLDYRDRRTAALFGDGAGAVVLDRVPEPYGFLHSDIGSEGDKEEYVRVVRVDDRADDPYVLLMDGRAVRGYIEQRLPELLDRTLSATGLALADLDLVIPHQANVRLLDTVLEKAGVTERQIWSTGHLYGNTGAASVPITLESARQAAKLTDGALVLLAGLGAGMTWGSALLRWCPIAQQPASK